MSNSDHNYTDLLNIKVRLNIPRLIAFLVAYGIFGVAIFLYFRSYVCFLFLVIFALMPFVSVYMLKVMLRRISVQLFVSEAQINVGSDLGIGIIVKNPSIFTSLCCKCYLSIRNLYYGEEINQIFTVPLVASSDNKNPLYCKVKNCGIIEVSLDKCEVYDVLGFVRAQFETSQSVCATVLPIPQNLEDIQKLGILAGFTDNEDDTQKGNEYSDTSNIREYIPGDRIKDIHWKLSAKKGELLVREHIKSCENKLVLWIDPSPRKKFCEQILALSYSVVDYCLKENALVRVMWCDASFTVYDVTVNSISDLIKAYESMYRSKKANPVTDLRSLLLMNDHNMKSVLRVGYNGSEVELTPYDI